MHELDVLRRLGDEVVPPSLESLRATARRRDRRSSAAVLAAGAAAVVAVTVTAAVLGTGDDPSPRPVEPPRTEESPSRPLTYADGSTVHYGDRTVDAEGRVVELDLTDEGVAFRTEDGRIWFTDGSETTRLGDLGDPGPAYRGDVWPLLVQDGWLVSPHEGSRVAWFEFAAPGRPQAVVYDTRSHEQVGGATVDVAAGNVALPYLLSERYLYWFADADPGLEAVDTPTVRYDPATGEQAPVTWQRLQADLARDASPRSVMVGTSDCDPCPALRHTDGTDRNWSLGHGRLTPQGAQPLVAETVAGTKFAFHVPPGPSPNVAVWLTQWRDDDTVVFVSQTPGETTLLECRLDTRDCEVVLARAAPIVAPEVG